MVGTQLTIGSAIRAGCVAILLGLSIGTTMTGCESGCSRKQGDPRLENAAGLVEGGSLIGLHESQLAETLGPEAVGKTFVGWDKGYYVGPDASCVDSEWLVLRMDATGTVVDAQLYFD